MRRCARGVVIGFPFAEHSTDGETGREVVLFWDTAVSDGLHDPGIAGDGRGPFCGHAVEEIYALRRALLAIGVGVPVTGFGAREATVRREAIAKRAAGGFMVIFGGAWISA